MRIRRAIIAFLAAASVLCALCTVSAFADGGRRVYAEATETVTQGSYGYAYVYVDDLGDIASLNIALYYDSAKITVTEHYNQVGCSLYDASNANGCLQYSYIFDGEGSNERTNLFYFCYYISEDAVVGDTYFDIVVTDAYNKSLEVLDVSGSRCSFKINEAPQSRECYVWGDSEIGTSVKEEFDVSYYFDVCDIASGSAVITYDPELFEVVSVTNGDFLDGKLVDINSSLEGSIYVSFLSTEYRYAWNFLNIRFRTLKNADERSEIKLTVSELYDLKLNKIICGGYTTAVNVAYDEAYIEDAPSMTLHTSYNAEAEKVTLTVKLDRDSMLGAGDFVLRFNANYLTYVSAVKGFNPTFFNINNKNVSDGILKFSIISMSDITDAETVLTVTFDVNRDHDERIADFEISGSGLTDALTNTIVLNFIGASVTIPLEHTAATATMENRVEPDCENAGSYDSVVYCSVCKSELSRETRILDKLGHDYSTEWTVDLKPTCTTEGSKSRHCSRCDDKADVTVIPADGHSFGNWYTITAPTCTENGTDEHECSVCLDKETKSTNALGHTPAEAVVENRVEPDCENVGSYDSVVYCSVCDTELSRETKILDKFGHDHSTEWTVDLKPTCTTEGSKSRHCSRCDDKADVTVIPADGHSYGDWYTITAPTCTEKGTDEHECSVCHDKETKSTNALGHTHAEAVVENRVEPDCEEAGSYDSVVYCSVCKKELSRVKNNLNALGHTHAEAVVENRVEPDCENAGSYDSVVYCSVCKKELTRVKNNVNALGHAASSAVEENRVEPNCTTDGRYDSVVYCSVCKSELSRETKILDKLGHDHSTEWTVDLKPTCTTEGSKSHHCSRCDDKADVTVIPANGHSFGDWYTITAPTCTEKGTDEHECSVCHDKETKSTNALGHAPSEAVVENRVEPNCTADGHYDSVVYCSVCKSELSRETKTINKLGHDYSTEWTVDLKPTCTTEGSKSHHCSRCGDKADVTVIPANGHSFGDWYTITAPTCTEKGTDEHECSVCHDKETKSTNALGHTPAEAVVENRVEPDCENAGSYDDVVYCSVCKIELTRVKNNLNALGHTPSEAVEENRVEPDCENAGSYDSVVYCSVCKSELLRETKTINKLGHDYSTEWTVDLKPTCTTEGSKSHHCLRCDDKADVTVIPADGHSFGGWVVILQPTYDDEGTERRECTLCECAEERAVAAIGYAGMFSDLVGEIAEAEIKMSEQTYSRIVYALEVYGRLTEEEKAESATVYQTLEAVIAEYNAVVDDMNNAQAEASELALAPVCALYFTFMAAVWFVLKKLIGV